MARKNVEVIWKRGAIVPPGLTAKVAYNELEAIRKSSPTGELQPAEIVSAAKKKKSPLHVCFTWDDAQAAAEYRIVEARQLIRSIHVVHLDAPEHPGRQYEIDRNAPLSTDRRGYRPVDDILADDESRAALLQRALGDLLAARRKYARLQELAIVFRAVDKVLEELKP